MPTKTTTRKPTESAALARIEEQLANLIKGQADLNKKVENVEKEVGLLREQAAGFREFRKESTGDRAEIWAKIEAAESERRNIRDTAMKWQYAFSALALIGGVIGSWLGVLVAFKNFLGR